MLNGTFLSYVLIYRNVWSWGNKPGCGDVFWTTFCRCWHSDGSYYYGEIGWTTRKALPYASKFIPFSADHCFHNISYSQTRVTKRPRPLLLHYLASVPGCKFLREISPPDHNGVYVKTPLPGWLQAETLSSSTLLWISCKEDLQHQRTETPSGMISTAVNFLKVFLTVSHSIFLLLIPGIQWNALLFTSVVHHSWLLPRVRIGDEGAPLNRSPKIWLSHGAPTWHQSCDMTLA